MYTLKFNDNNNNNEDLYSVLAKNQHNALYCSYTQIKTFIKRDSITLATKHVTITTMFKCMPSTTRYIAHA